MIMITTTKTTTTTTTVLLQTTIISDHDYHTTAWKLTCIGNLFEENNSQLWKKSKIGHVYGYITSRQHLDWADLIQITRKLNVITQNKTGNAADHRTIHRLYKEVLYFYVSYSSYFRYILKCTHIYIYTHKKITAFSVPISNKLYQY
jgi:hypothetical protein